jgi:UDP-glucose 4-epimerase
MTTKKILITGGSGFIGTHLTRLLLDQGHHVTILDLNSSTLTHPHLIDLNGDIRNSKDIERAITSDLDYIFHLAAIVSVPECEKNPELSFETNLLGTQNILNRLVEIKSQKTIPIFFSSSAAVYGDLCKPGHKLNEREHLPKPLSFYGLHKYASEQSIRLYCENLGLRGFSFRFFNVYGPGQKPDSPYSGVITIFKKAMDEGTGIKLFNHGKNIRDFIHVSEIAKGCILAMQTSVDQMNGESLNFCTGKEISIQHLFDLMSSTKGPANKVTLLPARSGDIEYSCGDATFADSKIGFKPKTDLNLNW